MTAKAWNGRVICQWLSDCTDSAHSNVYPPVDSRRILGRWLRQNGHICQDERLVHQKLAMILSNNMWILLSFAFFIHIKLWVVSEYSIYAYEGIELPWLSKEQEKKIIFSWIQLVKFKDKPRGKYQFIWSKSDSGVRIKYSIGFYRPLAPSFHLRNSICRYFGLTERAPRFLPLC